ncbi:cytochrome P450 81D11-like [Coffea eugenioides]|uniref:cytochrome P450 81D11-like n=1 Tax=Coffea eugenioides TaxID=49369 RepID=UPI000F611BF1|nr:cytochrome P450 81D11-like [Coffea eugenioides]
MERAMFLLLNHPEVLQKAKSEINNHLTDSGRLLDDLDLSKLPYLCYIINETLRLYLQRQFLHLIVHLKTWAIHRDPNLWEEPSKFKPERFEGLDVGFKFLPFGKGRRACSGAAMAMRLVGLVVGNVRTLVQCFEWGSVGSETVGYNEKSGLTFGKTKPLEAMYKPCPPMINIISQL